MREAVKQTVAALIPELEGRIYDVQPPAGGDDGPYAVLTLGEEIWKSAWAGYRQVVRVKLYGGSAVISRLDDWAQQLIRGLQRKRIAGPDPRAILLHYLGVPEADALDPASGGIIRCLRFGAYLPEASGAEAPAQSDAWLSTLAEWTRGKLDDMWQVYETSWPADREEHAVLWRLAGCETKMAGASMYEVRKTFAGHLAAPFSETEHHASVTLVEQLGAQTQLPLGDGERRYLSVAEVSANLQVDAILEGQLKLTLVQRRMRPAEDAALIRRVAVQPIMK
ncbi:hypothetical protein [Paenibacillus sp. XY044]|uniref:hypothetical protein n=1 Tax=Paenibacillus sp. XY044 TaxID=2026089 RepID=UPI000B985E80|nr:hypothetical protein [Paenibacillus sp. XY044]OZB95931.1 hypothetical protein CJP46_08300 [Paenibacillus sp. XY044]